MSTTTSTPTPSEVVIFLKGTVSTTAAGTTIIKDDAGPVQGPQGKQGIVGPVGPQGVAGVSVTGATINSAGHLVLTMSNGTRMDAGALPTSGTVTPPVTPTTTATWSGAQLSAVSIPGTYKDSTGASFTFAEPWDAINAAALAPTCTMTVAAGTYLKPFSIAQGGNITIIGAGAYKTLFDGQGGFTQGHRLAWGKAFLHTMSPGSVTGVGFVNCGGLPFSSDYENQAGVYIESFTASGSFTVNKCAFDANNNGVFAPRDTAPVVTAVKITNCDFGMRKSNGADQSGLCHDIYVQSGSLTLANNIHFGNTWGNNVKSRSPKLTITGGYNAALGGRCIDYPEGGALSVSGGVYTQVPGANANLIEYAAENQNNVQQDCTIDGITLSIGRFATAIWMQPAGKTLAFTNVTQDWFQMGTAPASIVLNGNGGLGAVTGLALAPSATDVIHSGPAIAPATATS